MWIIISLAAVKLKYTMWHIGIDHLFLIFHNVRRCNLCLVSLWPLISINICIVYQSFVNQKQNTRYTTVMTVDSWEYRIVSIRWTLYSYRARQTKYNNFLCKYFFFFFRIVSFSCQLSTSSSIIADIYFVYFNDPAPSIQVLFVCLFVCKKENTFARVVQFLSKSFFVLHSFVRFDKCLFVRCVCMCILCS